MTRQQTGALAKLAKLGFADPLVDALCRDRARRAAFEEQHDLLWCVVYPSDATDPCFVELAHVGDGAVYGCYAYPPLRAFPIIAIDDEVIAICAGDLRSWLGESRVKRVSARTLFPRTSGSLHEFLATPMPRKRRALLAHERQWSAWWRRAVDDLQIGEDETNLLLIAGIEIYERLAWPLPLDALRRALREREPFDVEYTAGIVWAQHQRPRGSSAERVIAAALEGSAHAHGALAAWLEDTTADRARFDARAERDRAVIGSCLAAALAVAPRSAQRQLASWLVEHGPDHGATQSRSTS